MKQAVLARSRQEVFQGDHDPVPANASAENLFARAPHPAGVVVTNPEDLGAGWVVVRAAPVTSRGWVFLPAQVCTGGGTISEVPVATNFTAFAEQGVTFDFGIEDVASAEVTPIGEAQAIIEMSAQDFNQIRSSQEAEIARVRATLDRDVDSLPLEDD